MSVEMFDELFDSIYVKESDNISASPSGNNTEVQFNDDGILSTKESFIFNKTTDSFKVGYPADIVI
jgi:hypothetical protein